jgi:tetratricopeptide (TPR) repeat protein
MLERCVQQARDNDYPGALQSFAKAISLRPESAQPQYSREAAYHHMEQYEAAIRDHSEAIRPGTADGPGSFGNRRLPGAPEPGSRGVDDPVSKALG